MELLMEISVNVTGPEVKPVLIDVIGKRETFRVVNDPHQPVYILDSWDDSYYYVINLGQMQIESLTKDVRVFPVKIKTIKVELELA